MAAVSEFILVRDGVYDRVQTVNIDTDPDCLLLDAGINFRNRLNLRVYRFRILIELTYEIDEGLNSKIDPLAEVRVGKISELKVVLRIESRLLLESRDCIVIETRPGIFPAFEMRHPVRNVNVNAVDAGPRDLPDTFHVDLAPFPRIRSHPNIFVSFLDPKCGSAAKNRRLTCDLALQQVGMIFRHRACSFVPMTRHALRPCDVDESIIADAMGFLRDRPNPRQFF